MPPTPGFSESYVKLRDAQKSNKGAPLYSLLVNRPLGRVFAAAAHQLRMTPNQVTMLSAAFTFSGIAMIALLAPGWASSLAITLALVVGYALDSADGQLARLRGGGSLTGEWLDHVIDSFKIATLHLAVLIGLFRFVDVADWWLLVPIVFSAVGVIHFFGMLLTEQFTKGRLAGEPDLVNPPKVTVRSALKLPTDYGLLCLLFALRAIESWFLVGYLLLALASLVYTGLALGSWYRRVQLADRHHES